MIVEKKISVLVPVYGVEKYIERCARSLFSNTYANICKFIFLNDCTKDNSIEILKNVVSEFPDLDIEIMENETNLGLCLSRQVLLDAAIGKYVIHIDSDDWVEPDFIELLYKKAEENNADITTCGIIYEYGDRKREVKQVFKEKKEELLKEFITHTVKHVVWNKIFRLDLIRKNNIQFYQRKNCNFCDDSFFTGDCLLVAQKFASVEKCLNHYNRININSVSLARNQMFFDVKKQHSLTFEKKLLDLYPNEDFSEAFSYDRCQIKWEVMLNTFALRKHNYQLFKGCQKKLQIKDFKSFFQKLLFWNCDIRNYVGVEILLFLRHVFCQPRKILKKLKIIK